MTFIPRSRTINYATPEAGVALGRGQQVVGVDFHVLLPLDSLSLYMQQPDAAEHVGAMLASLLAKYAPDIIADVQGPLASDGCPVAVNAAEA